ncbi:glycine dehydrogenase subunit 2 [bacterium]|nr:glycine dehydrogenase subunit 2 [bacterium]
MTRKNIRFPLSIEQSRPGHTGFSLPSKTIGAVNEIPENLRRKSTPGLPELSELQVVRHFTNLSTANYSIDSGMYPLGSCTMKYNPRINEKTASNPKFLNIHPRTPDKFAQGCMSLMYELQMCLKEISGFEQISLQPAAGAQGEYVGIRMIRAYHDLKGNHKKTKILIPESAHGTNCATAVMCGYQVVPVKANERGILSLETIKEHCAAGDIAGIMITNPNTVGLFEEDIVKIAKHLHEVDALVYCDGANLNAKLGLTRPGDAGVDVMHFNLHKTFTTPHGGGGPGCGAVGVSARLQPHLPTPILLKKSDGSFEWDTNRPSSIGSIKDYNGHFLMMVRALTYIRELGPEGIRKISRDAILLANYVRVRLGEAYHVAFERPCMHEVVLSDKKQKGHGVKTIDIAKRLIDLGIHPPTIYFPLIVDGAIMIEPTETESLEEVENFCLKMLQIAAEAEESDAFAKYFAGAPKTTPTTRINETKAARDLVLSWKEL